MSGDEEVHVCCICEEILIGGAALKEHMEEAHPKPKDGEVEVVPRQQPRIVLRAARSARPREQAPPMRLIDYWGTARFGQATNSGARQAATSVTGPRQGSFENGGCCISAAPGEDARFKFRKMRHVRFQGIDGDKDLQGNKIEAKKCDGDSEGVGEKVMALEKDIKDLKEKKKTKENLKAAIEVRKKKHLEDMKKVANESKKIKEMENDFKKMETDIGAKLEQKEEELKKVLEEAVVQVGGPSPSPEGRHIKFLLASIARKAASLECPVCLEEAAVPIFGCEEFHVLCGGCRDKVAACPTCREEWGRGGPQRNRFAEERAGELEGMRVELRAATT